MDHAEWVHEMTILYGERHAHNFRRAADALDRLAALERELADARKDGARLEKATKFDLGPMPGQPEHWTNHIHVVRCEGHMLPKQPYMWAVKWFSDVLAKDGTWGWEPLPSSRDDEFYARCRFDTIEEAWAAALAAIDAAMGGE